MVNTSQCLESLQGCVVKISQCRFIMRLCGKDISVQNHYEVVWSRRHGV